MGYPASEKQLNFLNTLTAERVHNLTAGELDEACSSSRTASALIDALLKAPRVQVAGSPDPVTEPGMYRTSDGRIFKVQKSRSTWNLYAKELVDITGRRLTEINEVVGFEFVYAPGAMRNLTADDRLSVEEAKAFGIRFGVCCVCGAHLKDAKSVAEGIGPVCGKRV